MKREGRMPGSLVRLRKQQQQQQGDGVKAPTKPSSHSRMTGRCAGNKSRCLVCPVGQPAHRAAGKAKAEPKAADNRLDEWRVCYSAPSSESSSFHGDEFEHFSDYEESATEDEDELEASATSSDEARENLQRTSDMVLPIQSFLRTVRRVRRLPPVREVASEEDEDEDDKSVADSDSSWSEVERCCADLDDWFVVG
ncbi:hypothetical protein MPTK1_8g15360 [Marchantia polymorpha subsp. ruderalis]|nr:hypothetical protein Mp_8g15360 [Marchantia polymorpha subsp. ruderalis]